MIDSATPLLLDGASKKPNRDDRVQVKSWILMIIRAVEEDLARQVPACANQCCRKVLPRKAKAFGWKKRSLLGHKQWLCEACNQAYDARQFCEFCTQIYLKSNLERAGLDGKEWAQCEGSNDCSRWAHVECLGKKHGKTRDEIVADDFKYFCCKCRALAKGKKRIRSEKKHQKSPATKTCAKKVKASD